MVRFRYAVVALILWVFFMAWITTGECGIKLSNDTQILSLAIIMAGAMAGGDND